MSSGNKTDKLQLTKCVMTVIVCKTSHKIVISPLAACLEIMSFISVINFIIVVLETQFDPFGGEKLPSDVLAKEIIAKCHSLP